jgi:hemerythrin-like domain-containing protein
VATRSTEPGRPSGPGLAWSVPVVRGLSPTLLDPACNTADIPSHFARCRLLRRSDAPVRELPGTKRVALAVLRQSRGSIAHAGRNDVDQGQGSVKLTAISYVRARRFRLLKSSFWSFMADPIALWHAEHVGFSRLLDLLEKQVAAFHGGERPSYELMRDNLFYLRHFPDRFHHPREDVAFARLVERAPSMELPINRLLQEHRVIAAAGEELLMRLNEVDEGSVVARATVEAAAATYLVYYRHHLATEEREILPRAAKLLTQDDWAAVAAAVPAGPDPLFGDDGEARFQELRRQILLEARAL